MISRTVKVEVHVGVIKLKAEADNLYRGIGYSGYQKTKESNNCFIIW